VCIVLGSAFPTVPVAVVIAVVVVIIVVVVVVVLRRRRRPANESKYYTTQAHPHEGLRGSGPPEFSRGGVRGYNAVEVHYSRRTIVGEGREKGREGMIGPPDFKTWMLHSAALCIA